MASLLFICTITNVEEPVLMEPGTIALSILITNVPSAMTIALYAQDLSTLSAHLVPTQPMDLLTTTWPSIQQYAMRHVQLASLLTPLFPIYVWLVIASV